MYCLEMGTSNVMRHKAMSLAALTVTTICLLLIGCLFLLSQNTELLLSGFQAGNTMLAFVEDGADDKLRTQAGQLLISIPGVKEVRYITKEEAFVRYKEEYGANDTTYLSAAVFRDRYSIEIEQDADVDAIKAEVRAVNGVADIRSDEKIMNGFRAARNLIRIVGGISVVIMITAAVVIILNTLKLTIISRRDEYAVMRMMGAKPGLFWTPLLTEGGIIGWIAALAAFACSFAIYMTVDRVVRDTGSSALFEIIPFGTLGTRLLCCLLLLGLSLGVGGSLLAGFSLRGEAAI